MPDGLSKRTQKLQIMLSLEELQAIDDWRFSYRLPSRAAAIRELVSRGLKAEDFPDPEPDKRSGEFAVTDVGEIDEEAGDG